MNEMLQTVAKAIGDALYGYCDPVETPNTWADAICAARAAIESMREPNDQMIATIVGFEADEDSTTANLITSHTGREVWRTMIDVALEH